MPRLLDYADAAGRLAAAGFVSLYHHSGAWGFDGAPHVQTLGWIGPDDPTIRPQAMAHVRRVSPPHAANLARLLEQAWPSHLPGEAWLSPRSHWHYELNFGNRELLEPLLEELNINPGLLRGHNDGAPILFGADEPAMLRRAVERLLQGLRQSDFQLTFPGHRTICVIHHHCQLWWQTTKPDLTEILHCFEKG